MDTLINCKKLTLKLTLCNTKLRKTKSARSALFAFKSLKMMTSWSFSAATRNTSSTTLVVRKWWNASLSVLCVARALRMTLKSSKLQTIMKVQIEIPQGSWVAMRGMYYRSKETTSCMEEIKHSLFKIRRISVHNKIYSTSWMDKTHPTHPTPQDQVQLWCIQPFFICTLQAHPVHPVLNM